MSDKELKNEFLDRMIKQMKQVEDICNEYPPDLHCEGVFISQFHPANNIREVIENIIYDKEEEDEQKE